MKRSDSILQQLYFSSIPKAQEGMESPGWFSRIGKDLRTLFGIEEEKPKTVTLKMPQKIRIQDARTKSLTTGQKINPNRDLVSGEYPSNRIYNIVRAAKRYGIDPYDALAIDLQETGFGTSQRSGNQNVGHVIMNRWNDRLVPSKRTEEDDPEFEPFDTFGQVLATKMQEADRLGYQDPYMRFQVYNGLGKISGNTEKKYHGFKMKSIYGVPIPAEGIDMRKNPLYGKRVVDLRDNVLKPNKDLEYWIKYIKQAGGPIVDSRGQWAHPGKVTRIPGSNITMQDVPYPVLAKPSSGKSKVMMPGMNYSFPGAKYVDEYPINVKLPKLDSERMGMYAEPSIDFWQGQPYFGATVGHKTPKIDVSANYMYGVPSIGARINFQTGGIASSFTTGLSDEIRRQNAQRVVQIARQRAKDNNWVEVPESIQNTEWSKSHGAYSCIGGVCTVLNEAGVIPKVMWSNTEFAKEAGNLGFNKENKGWGLKGIQNLEPGDVVQYLHGEPGHAQIFLGVNDETGEYEFFDNFSNSIRNYSESSVESQLDPVQTNNRSGMQIWKVNPYHAPVRPEGQPYDKNADRLIRDQRKRLEHEIGDDKMIDRVAYEYRLREDSPYANRGKGNIPTGMTKFFNFANDEENLRDTIKKIYKSGYPSRATRDQLHDSLLNVFGILGQENKWENPWIGGDISPSFLPRIPLESTIEKAFSPESLSIGPGQIKFASLNPKIRRAFKIRKAEDLQDWDKVIPLMVGLDIANKQWMENQGEKFSERIIGEPGLTSQQMKWSEGRLSPYFYRGPGNPNIRKQLARQFDKSISGQLISTFSPDEMNAAREKYISENIRGLQKVFDPGSYGQNVYENIDKNLERIQITPWNSVATDLYRETYPIELPPVTVTAKKKQRYGGQLYKKEQGGQHGGLDRWFAEKWVDVKTGKTCGRQEGENRAYPACRPSRRVSSETPKTSSEMSPAEKAKFKRSKTSSERISYNHQRKQFGGMSTADSVRHQANKILQYEQLQGGPGGSPLAYYSDPKYMKMLMDTIYPQVKNILPNASAMEAGEAMDFIFNAGWDKNNKKILRDPRAYALQEYYKQYDRSKLDKDGKWPGRKNPAYSFDQEYNTTIGKLPENDRRVMMNRGRDWYYRNINNPAPGVPNDDYYNTWYGRIWNTNDFLPFNPNNSKFKPKKK